MTHREGIKKLIMEKLAKEPCNSVDLFRFVARMIYSGDQKEILTALSELREDGLLRRRVLDERIMYYLVRI